MKTSEQNDTIQATETEAKFGHTPGPWFTLDTGLDVYAEYQNQDPDYLPRLRHVAAAVTTCQFDQEARANAALIAAAPELLAALEEITRGVVDCPALDSCRDWDPIIQAAWNAIAKAKGHL